MIFYSDFYVSSCCKAFYSLSPFYNDDLNSSKKNLNFDSLFFCTDPFHSQKNIYYLSFRNHHFCDKIHHIFKSLDISPPLLHFFKPIFIISSYSHAHHCIFHLSINNQVFNIFNIFSIYCLFSTTLVYPLLLYQKIVCLLCNRLFFIQVFRLF